MSAIVVSLHSAPHKHAPMTLLSVAHLVPGKGIEGDRYFARRLPQSDAKTHYEVTLVELEALEALHTLRPETATEPSGRRNIVVRACPLQTLAGSLFYVGEVLLYGAALRDAPCDSPEHTQHSVCDRLHQQWLGASILTEGFVSPGDRIEKLALTIEDFQRERLLPPLIRPTMLPEQPSL